ncbi:MAG: lysophospholipid acyltransferase family protein, partial [Burkholderiaceae bacterium]
VRRRHAAVPGALHRGGGRRGVRHRRLMPAALQGVRAALRLSRCVAHSLHCAVIVGLRFRSLDAGQRHARIGWWSTKMLRLMGVALQTEGAPIAGGVLLVANHVSWLDILAVHAVLPHARFVAKADVKSWPVIARLVNAADTLYLERERKRDALRVVHLMAQALQQGQTVVVFPEGTTSDGQVLLPFHANLLQAAIASGAPVQPVALRFSDASGPVSCAVEFVGATTLIQSLWRVACGQGVRVRVSLLAPRTAALADRRVLGEALRADIVARLAQG